MSSHQTSYARGFVPAPAAAPPLVWAQEPDSELDEPAADQEAIIAAAAHVVSAARGSGGSGGSLAQLVVLGASGGGGASSCDLDFAHLLPPLPPPPAETAAPAAVSALGLVASAAAGATAVSMAAAPAAAPRADPYGGERGGRGRSAGVEHAAASDGDGSASSESAVASLGGGRVQQEAPPRQLQVQAGEPTAPLPGYCVEQTHVREVTQTVTHAVTHTVTTRVTPAAAPEPAWRPRAPAPGPVLRSIWSAPDCSQRNQLTGALGELFAFEWLRERLPGFDSDCWRSCNRTIGGLAAPNAESVVDFFYVDAEGALTGRRGAACCIEVKSTARADGGVAGDAFVLSQAQLELAYRLRGREDAAFVIVRVVDAGGGPGSRPLVARVIVDPADRLGRELLLSNTGDVCVTIAG
jgi:hypothetical protein